MRSDLARLEVGRKPRLLQRLRGHRQSVRVLGAPPKKTDGTSKDGEGRLFKGALVGVVVVLSRTKGNTPPMLRGFRFLC